MHRYLPAEPPQPDPRRDESWTAVTGQQERRRPDRGPVWEIGVLRCFPILERYRTSRSPTGNWGSLGSWPVRTVGGSFESGSRFH